MIDGILWAADHGAGVVNISYDISGTGAAISEAAQYLRSKGGLVVLAAGNSNTDKGHGENPYMIRLRRPPAGCEGEFFELRQLH